LIPLLTKEASTESFPIYR